VTADGRPAAEIADALKAEADELLHVDPARSLAVAERIRDLGDGSRALAELAVADAQRELGRYADAAAAYARAAELYSRAGDEVGWARSRIGATLTWRYTGVTADQLAEIDRARLILSEHELWLRLARLEQHTGVLLCELGHLDDAACAYERALDAARRLAPRDETQEARVLGNLALVYQRLGEYERANSLLSSALGVFEQHGHARHLAVGKSISAQLLVDQGHYSRALDTALSARRAFHDMRQTRDAAFVGRVAASASWL
jgi:tetratricopeptide (TPR) repeat protein